MYKFLKLAALLATATLLAAGFTPQATAQTDGASARTPASDPAAKEAQALDAKLQDLAKMRKAGVISEKEYVARKKQLTGKN